MSLRRSVLGLFILLTLMRLVFAAKLGLGDDEAYYWDWSRDLALSYYDHPGMVAWLIRLGCAIFGESPLGVRFFGLASYAFGGFFIWGLARDLFGERNAWISLFLYTFAPIFAVGGLLMVPDAPMAAAWMGYTWLLWRLWRNEHASPWQWVASGLVLGLGLLSKYTMFLLVISTIALFASEPRRRRELISIRFFIAALVTILCCVPIVLWNMHLDWPSIRFHLLDRQTGGGGANFSRWLQFWVSQLIVLGPVLFFVCGAALVTAVKRRRDPRWCFIAYVATPPLAIFAFQALFAEFKPHWPAPSYPLLFIGAVELWREGFGLINPRVRHIVTRSTVVLTVAFFILLNSTVYVATVVPLIPRLARMFAPNAPWDPKFDPTNDLYGWDEVAREVQRIRIERKARGESDFFLSSSRYQLTAQLKFATGEDVLRISPGRDHYTFTQLRSHWIKHREQDSIFIVDERYNRDPRKDGKFSDCRELSSLRVSRDGELARTFHFWWCHEFNALQGDE